MKMVARVEDLSVRDTKGLILKDVSLCLHEKECVGIIGESGSGKTMTMKALLGILPEDVEAAYSSLVINGVEMKGLSRREKRRVLGSSVGFVPQNTVDYLHPFIKIGRQMVDGYLTFNRKSRKEAYQRAGELLLSTGIEDFRRVMDSYPSELSGGMRQRVNIAMAMMCSPRLIIADEPTSALDSIVRVQVSKLYFDIGRNNDFALLIVSHDLEFMRKYCDRIVVMYAGRILEEGDTEEVFSNPLHPYTKALIALSPALEFDRSRRLPEIAGFVPEAGRETELCIFAPRCPYRCERCRNRVEKIEKEGHQVLCNLYSREDQV